MFGYININRNQLTEESKEAYQAYYCGLCQKLRNNFGAKGQMLLNYDMTFLIVLLTGLYELESQKKIHIRRISCGLIQPGRLLPGGMHGAGKFLFLGF